MLKRFLTTAAIAALVLSTSVQASGPAPTRDQQQFEIRFLTEMIDHHAMAVMMADLCLERATHPELRQLCHNIKEAQTEEIVTMQTWLEDWYGIEHQPDMTPGAQNRMQKLAALSGAEFEIEFLKEMIQHHWLAVVRARQCQDRAYHPELIEMCEDIETKQLAEIELMGSWLCEWYGLCNFHGSTG
jgi:uncharacterized protein (DUF305 family)